MKKHVPLASALFTRPQAATYLNVSIDTLRHFDRTGVLPKAKLGGNPKSRVQYRRADLDALIESGLVPATSGPLAT